VVYAKMRTARDFVTGAACELFHDPLLHGERLGPSPSLSEEL
jgi:hypothetical protein